MANYRPPVETLWEKYSYNPFTGRFHSIIDDYEYRGNLVGIPPSTSHQLSVSGKSRFPYGVCVFAWLNGRWPQEGLEIDHIDRNPFNHRHWNIREVTRGENMLNRRNRRNRRGSAKCKNIQRKRIQRDFKAPRS